jgi:hypothetical protein
MAAVVYVIKITKKHKKTIWKKIQILETQTLGDLDKIIRESFLYNPHDHLSEFYSGKVGHLRVMAKLNLVGWEKVHRKELKI